MKTWWIDRKHHFRELKDGAPEWTTLPILKFVLLRNEQGQVEAYCFQQELEHKVAAYLALGHAELPDEAFVGGGTILRPNVCHAVFQSPSCQDAFKYDRPEDAVEQGTLLLDATQSIRAAGYGTP